MGADRTGRRRSNDYRCLAICPAIGPAIRQAVRWACAQMRMHKISLSDRSKSKRLATDIQTDGTATDASDPGASMRRPAIMPLPMAGR